MVFLAHDRSNQGLVAKFTRTQGLPNVYDLIAAALIAACVILIMHGATAMSSSLHALSTTPISLNPHYLPGYALRTTLRMFAAIIFSLLFTFVIGTLAAKNRRAELVIIPILDILQSVPVLGFLTFTVTFFLGLFPGSQLGAEGASIFAIFTSQVWNMTFSFYQSLRTLPRDLDEVSRSYNLSSWHRFWRLEAPFAAPGLIWNTMMSMSGSWFFVVASEAITVGNTTITLPGIGSYLSIAIDKKDFSAIAYAVLTMTIVIILYDQFIFRPIVAWADKFRFEQTASQEKPHSFIYGLIRRTRLMKRLSSPLSFVGQRLLTLRLGGRGSPGFRRATPKYMTRVVDAFWLILVLGLSAWGVWLAYRYMSASLKWSDVVVAFEDGLLTLVRVLILVALASVIWTPIGVWVGLRPALAERIQPIAQFFAAFPANVLFPFFVVIIVATGANPNIWLSPLMILGTQWYILFNVIAGASAFPTDLKEAAAIYQVRSWTWWRRVMLPGVFPYFVTGAITATGGSWNASIVAEVASWGNEKLQATGLGAYIANATAAGDFPRVTLGIAVMSLFVTLFNRALWRPLYAYAARRLRLD
jgi:NitT/TauT family transport system permease protein